MRDIDGHGCGLGQRLDLHVVYRDDPVGQRLDLLRPRTRASARGELMCAG
jgi:hypothetical protein